MTAPRPGPSFLYNPDTSAAARARQGDLDYFKRNPSARVRVRPILEGESLLLDGLRARMPSSRGYMIVINHARACDRRAVAGLGAYPVFLPHADRETAKRLLRAEAERMVRWFKRSAATPPPMPGVALVTGAEI
jgi:hypothetical protein